MSKKVVETEDCDDKTEELVKMMEEKKIDFVPYDVFKQTVELNTENMRQLYSMLHELNMQKTFVVEVDMGGIKFVVSGNNDKSKDVVKAAEMMVDKFTKKFFTKAEVAKFIKETDKREQDVKKGYN